MTPEERLKQQAAGARAQHQQQKLQQQKYQERQNQNATVLGYDANAGADVLLFPDGTVRYAASLSNGARGIGETVQMHQGLGISGCDVMPAQKRVVKQVAQPVMETTYPVKVLFSLTNIFTNTTDFFIGGDRATPLKIASIPSSMEIDQAIITNTGSKTNDWIVSLLYDSNTGQYNSTFTSQVITPSASGSWSMIDPNCNFLSPLGAGFFASPEISPVFPQYLISLVTTDCTYSTNNKLPDVYHGSGSALGNDTSYAALVAFSASNKILEFSNSGNATINYKYATNEYENAPTVYNVFNVQGSLTATGSCNMILTNPANNAYSATGSATYIGGASGGNYCFSAYQNQLFNSCGTWTYSENRATSQTLTHHQDTVTYITNETAHVPVKPGYTRTFNNQVNRNDTVQGPNGGLNTVNNIDTASGFVYGTLIVSSDAKAAFGSEGTVNTFNDYVDIYNNLLLFHFVYTDEMNIEHDLGVFDYTNPNQLNNLNITSANLVAGKVYSIPPQPGQYFTDLSQVLNSPSTDIRVYDLLGSGGINSYTTIKAEIAKYQSTDPSFQVLSASYFPPK